MHLPDLTTLPTITDFAVVLRDGGEGGKHVEFAAGGEAALAGFPGWDHADRDLRHFVASDVPLGTIDEPYDDRDENWRIVIFENGGYVYILEGDAPDDDDFPVAFRVPRDNYLAAWAALIDEYNPITPLDDPQ